ncbi:hypothetical protein [Nitrosopumilus sp.]|uniref:hypothetical protein n=1 Tax=Nitrosopumilus sp. TaxID=2024843 RepID=UPI0034A091D7
MKTKFLIIFLIALLPLFGFINNAQALSCALPQLGTEYDNSDYVLHGKVLDKNYYAWDSRMPVVTFEVLESFKGDTSGQISVSVNENWDYKFENGFEYVIFVQKTESSLEIDQCSPEFLAFPSVVEIIRQVSISEGDMRSATSNIFYESLTEQEKLEFESINNLIQEKRVERWDSGSIQMQLTIIAFLLLIPITGVSVFVIFRRKKK